MTPATAFKVLTHAQMTALEHDGSFAGAPVDLNDHHYEDLCLIASIIRRFAD